MEKTQRAMSRWGLLMVGNQGPILACCEGFGINRTSTPLVKFDPQTLTGITASGRPYQLLGEPEPGYALMAFHSLWDPGDMDIRVVPPEEAVVIIQRNGNAPFRHMPEEQAALDQKKLEFLSAQFRRKMILSGIDDREAARRSGLTCGQLSGLLDADLSQISADEADQAFVRLVEAPRRAARTDFIVPDESSDEEQMPIGVRP